MYDYGEEIVCTIAHGAGISPLQKYIFFESLLLRSLSFFWGKKKVLISQSYKADNNDYKLSL